MHAYLFAVYVPGQLYSGFRSAGSAVNVDRITRFVSVLAAGYARSFVRRSCVLEKQTNNTTLKYILYV